MTGGRMNCIPLCLTMVMLDMGDRVPCPALHSLLFQELAELRWFRNFGQNALRFLLRPYIDGIIETISKECSPAGVHHAARLNLTNIVIIWTWVSRKPLC